MADRIAHIHRPPQRREQELTWGEPPTVVQSDGIGNAQRSGDAQGAHTRHLDGMGVDQIKALLGEPPVAELPEETLFADEQMAIEPDDELNL